MKTLLFLNKLDYDFLPLAEKLKEKGEEVEVVLIQDAVYLALENNGYSEEMRHVIEKGVKFHILEKDVQNRGVLTHLIPNLDFIDYDRLVDLLFSENQRVINL